MFDSITCLIILQVCIFCIAGYIVFETVVLNRTKPEAVALKNQEGEPNLNQARPASGIDFSE